MAQDTKANQQSLILAGGSLFTVTPEVHCLNIVGMVVSPRPAHASRIDVVGHDVVTVSERHLANGALPVLLNYFLIEQFPHFRFGTKLAVSAGMVLVFDPLHSEASDRACLLDRLAATAGERSINGTKLIATEFHGLLQDGFSRKKNGVRFYVCLRTDRVPFAPERFSCALVNWRMCTAWWTCHDSFEVRGNVVTNGTKKSV
jgi:hypothetical protein